MSPGPARGRGTRSVPAAGSPTLASPAGDRRGCGTGSPPLGAARTPALGGALEEGPRGRPCAGVSVSVPPAHRALPPPPPRVCVCCHLCWALGGRSPHPCAPGAGSTSANVTGVGNTKALPAGALAGLPKPQGRGLGGWGLRAGPP